MSRLARGSLTFRLQFSKERTDVVATAGEPQKGSFFRCAAVSDPLAMDRRSSRRHGLHACVLVLRMSQRGDCKRTDKDASWHSSWPGPRLS